MKVATAAAAGATLALAGCGGDAGDLMSIEATGGVAGGTHTVVVSGDGRGSCDRGPLKAIPGQRVLDAREIERDLGDVARRAADYPAPPGARRYVIRTKDGEVRWGERSTGLPSALPRAQLLELQLQRQLCAGPGSGG